MPTPISPAGQQLSNHQWETFFMLSTDQLSVLGFDGYIKRLNPAWEANLGYLPHRLMTMPLLDFVHQDDRSVTQDELEKLIRGQGTSSFENRIKAENGETRWLLWSASAHPEEEIIYLVGRDITDRKQVEFALARNTQIVEAVRALQSQYITATAPDTLFKNILDKLLYFTSSAMGLIIEFDDAAGEEHGMHVRAWSADLLHHDGPDLDNEQLWRKLQCHQLDDIAHAIRTTGKAVIHDTGSPTGADAPVRIDAALAIPLHFGQRLLGMAWLVNRPDGYTTSVQHQISPLLNSCANLIRALRENRGRQQAEEKLRLNEIRLRTILETVADGIITFDNHGTIETFNTAAETIFGYRADEAIGRNLAILMNENYEKLLARESDEDEANEVANMVGIGRIVQGRRKNGSSFPLDLTLSEMAIGGKLKFACVLRDITEQQLAARQLLETTSLHHAILDSANYSIISTDPDGVIRTFNHTAEQWLGYSAAEVQNKVTPALIHDVKEVMDYAHVLSKQLGREIEPGFDVFVAKAKLGLTDEREWTYVRKDGSTFPVLLSVTGLWDDHNQIIGFLGVGRDITERKKIDRMKNEFISTVSHELRTPLTSIRGSLGLIAAGIGGRLSDQTKTLVDIACNNSERLVRLINDILDIEKIESGKMHFQLENHALLPLLKHVIESNQSYATQHGVQIVIEHSERDFWVRVDSDRLIQVMTNLLSNAIKYSPAGATVTIRLDYFHPRIRVTVEDQGNGVPMEFREHIFQKFAQADSSDTRQKSGTGLGLSISKAIVESMHGEIGYDSVLGSGSRFYFYLPARSRNAKQPRLDDDELADTVFPRILICEDESDVATLLHVILEQAGFKPVIADTAERAKELIRDNTFAAMTLDLMLPGQDGISLIRELRADKATRSLPIIVVSAKADAGERSLNGGAMGVIDWLNKPIDQSRLISAVSLAQQSNIREKPAILHVEDDLDLQNVVKTILADTARISTATSLEQARRHLRERQFDLLILDIQLPDGSGLELLPTLRRSSPTTRVIIFSSSEVDRDTASAVSSILIKSRTSNSELLNTIQSLVHSRDDGTEHS